MGIIRQRSVMFYIHAWTVRKDTGLWKQQVHRNIMMWNTQKIWLSHRLWFQTHSFKTETKTSKQGL